MWRTRWRKLRCSPWYSWSLLHFRVQLDWSWALYHQNGQTSQTKVLCRQNQQQMCWRLPGAIWQLGCATLWHCHRLLCIWNLLVVQGSVLHCKRRECYWINCKWHDCCSSDWLQQVLHWLGEPSLYSRLRGTSTLRRVGEELRFFVCVRRGLLCTDAMGT